MFNGAGRMQVSVEAAYSGPIEGWNVAKTGPRGLTPRYRDRGENTPRPAHRRRPGLTDEKRRTRKLPQTSAGDAGSRFSF